MYNSRRKSFKQIALNPEDENSHVGGASARDSVRTGITIPVTAPSRSNTPARRRQRSTTAQSRRSSDQEEGDESDHERQSETPRRKKSKRYKFKVGEKPKRRITDKTPWVALSAETRSYLGQVVKSVARQKLRELDQIDDELTKGEAKEFLIRVPKLLDVEYERTLLPGVIDRDVFNPAAKEKAVQVRRKFDAALKRVAKDSLLLERKEEELGGLENELEVLTKQLEQKRKEKKVTLIPTKVYTQDYIQSLMLFKP